MRSLIVFASLVLAACGGGAEQDTAAGSAPEGAPDESVFDPLTSTLDRAQSVQDTVDRRTDELRERIEQQER